MLAVINSVSQYSMHADCKYSVIQHACCIFVSQLPTLYLDVLRLYFFFCTTRPTVRAPPPTHCMQVQPPARQPPYSNKCATMYINHSRLYHAYIVIIVCIYAHHPTHRRYNFPRVNRLQKMYSNLEQSHGTTHYPVFLKPSRKLSWWDVAGGLREHYAGMKEDPYAHDTQVWHRTQMM